MKIISPALLTVAVLSNPLAAGPMKSLTPLAPPSGFSVGANVGYSFGNASFQNRFAVPPLQAAPKGGDRGSGITGGVFVGYQHPLSQGWSVGSDLAVTGDTSAFDKKFQINPVTSLQIKIKRTATVDLVPTVTKQLNDTFTFFAGVGVSMAEFTGSTTLSILNPGPSRGFKQTALGVKGTLGVEVAVNEALSVTGSVSYTDYSSVTKGLKGFGADYMPNQVNQLIFKSNYITPALGVRYKL